MAELSIIISLFGFASSLSSIIFAYLAFKRNNHIDSKEVGEESGQLQAGARETGRFGRTRPYSQFPASRNGRGNHGGVRLAALP